MPRLKWIAGFVLATLLSGCAGSGPTDSALDVASRQLIKVDSVVVSVEKLGGTTQGRRVSSASVRTSIEREAASLVGEGSGSVPTRVLIEVESVNLITAGQSIMIGGESIMAGTASLVDLRNGSVIIPPTKIDAGGGGWVLGGVVAAATRDDPSTELRQMSSEFVDRVRVLIFGN